MSPRRRRPPVTPEKVEQSHIKQLLETFGAKVYVFGNHRRKGDFYGTMQTEGAQDLQAFVPRRDHPIYTYEFVIVEAKSSAGRLRPQQRELQAFCRQAGIPHIVGTYDAVVAWLLERGYATRDQFPAYRLPPVRTS